jgi:hypothetical protein
MIFLLAVGSWLMTTVTKKLAVETTECLLAVADIVSASLHASKRDGKRFDNDTNGDGDGNDFVATGYQWANGASLSSFGGSIEQNALSLLG